MCRLDKIARTRVKDGYGVIDEVDNEEGINREVSANRLAAYIMPN